MDTRPSSPLEDAIDAARALPGPQQDAIAAELLERVQQLTVSRLSDVDTAEVKRRLAEPAQYASDDELSVFFSRHGISD